MSDTGKKKDGEDDSGWCDSVACSVDSVTVRLAAYYSLYMTDTLLDLDLSPDTLCSGWMCVILLLSFFPFRRDARDLPTVVSKVMAYVALYLMVDHYLDSPDITVSEKKDILEWLGNPLPSEDAQVPSGSENARKSKILHLVDELDGRSEASMLAKMVTDSYHAQINSRSSGKEYLRACADKGGITVVVGVRLTIGKLKGVREKDLYRLGYCIQLLDDLVDCSDDRRNGINTACTWCLRERGNVDEMVWRLLYESTRLPKTLRYHSLGIRCVAVRVCSRTGNVSPVLRSVLGIGEGKMREECLRLRLERALRRAI